MSRDGRGGPTRRQASGPYWRRTSPGLYVPAWVDEDIVEQRIVEQEARMPGYGAVTAWAALRWRGAAYFDGQPHGRRLPVPLTIGEHMIRGDARVAIRRGQLASSEWERVAGLRCTTWQRALYDEIVRLDSLRPGVIAFDMALAAGVADVEAFWDYLERVRPRNGVVLAREVTKLARPGARSPREVSMRMCWTHDAGLPEPLVNVPVFDLSGNLIGIPDLFDEEAGLVGEYQGAIHRDRDRHRSDVWRAERFRDHGLEYLELVGPDIEDVRTPARIRQVRSRALFLPPEKRRWTLDPPAWWAA